MKKIQVQIQNPLSSKDNTTFIQKSNSRVKENNTSEHQPQVQNQNLGTLPPKLSIFKSMAQSYNNQPNQISVQIPNMNNSNSSNRLSSQIKPPSVKNMHNIPIISSSNQFRSNILPSSPTPPFQTFLPSVMIQQQQYNQKMPNIQQLNPAAPKISDTYKLSPSSSRIRWTKQEDEQLMNLVRKWGARKWNEIAASLGTKTAKQCRDHYANCLDPEIKNSLWTVEEERILLSKYEQFGPHWSRIKSFLPGRTTSMIKNYITMLLKKNGKEVSAEIQVQKNKSESNSSGSNSASENEDHENVYIEAKEMPQNDINVHSIAFLLNRPTTYPNSL